MLGRGSYLTKKALNRSIQTYITIEWTVNKCRHVCVTELDFDSQLSLLYCLKTISSGWTCNSATHMLLELSNKQLPHAAKRHIDLQGMPWNWAQIDWLLTVNSPSLVWYPAYKPESRDFRESTPPKSHSFYHQRLTEGRQIVVYTKWSLSALHYIFVDFFIPGKM